MSDALRAAVLLLCLFGQLVESIREDMRGQLDAAEIDISGALEKKQEFVDMLDNVDNVDDAPVTGSLDEIEGWWDDLSLDELLG